MEDFTYHCPTKIIFGKGSEKKVAEQLKGHKVLFHYGGGSIKRSGLYDSIISSLEEEKIDFVELGGVVPNPHIDLVYEGIDLCKKEEITFILAVGGGSVIDSAKAIAMGYYHEGDVWDFFSQRIPVEKALPVGVVLTIPAAGSESSFATVITKDKEKFGYAHDLLRPVFAILNPELTMTLPAFQTACGVADMMAHIFERYFTKSDNVSFTDELCEGALRSIMKNAPLALENPENYAYRAELMLAGKVAHDGSLGMGRSEEWTSHAIEHELSAHYDIAHGAGLAIVFPSWMRYVYKEDIARFARLARNVFDVVEENDEQAALNGITSLKYFFKKIGLPVTLKEVGIDAEKLELMAAHCTPCGSLKALKKDDVVAIYEQALE